MTTKHTPGPLRIGNDGNGPTLEGSNGELVAYVCNGDDKCNVEVDAKANAARLALCWNMHDELVEALLDASRLIACCNRVVELNRENYPHRSPVWAYDHPDSPIKLAMNNLLHAIDKCSKGKARAAIAKATA